MRPNQFRLPVAPCLLLALLPLAGACTREPAESNAPTTAPAASAASAASPTSATTPPSAAPATPPASAASTAPTASAAPAASAASAAAAGGPAALPAVPRSTAIAKGHVVLTGDYQADSDAEVTCATADTALQLTFLAPGKPRVLLLLEDLAAKKTSGTYKGQVSILASDAGEGGFRQSGGKANAEVTVEDAPAGKTGKAVSGSFATGYTGDAGKGKVQGRFESCIFKPESADHP
jgi:hypothetical protein